MRDLLIFAAIFFTLPFCFARPYIGVMVFSWISYMNPHRLTWSAAYDFNFAFIVASVTLLGFIYQGMRNGKLFYFPKTKETLLLAALWLMFLITTYTAIYQDDAWREFERISKVLVITFLTITLIDDIKKLKYLMLVIAFSIGFYGFKGGLFSIATGGNYMLVGPPESALADNTALGLAINMTLPFLYYLGRNEQNKWLRLVLFATFYTSVVATLFTYSRGALVGLAVVLFYIYMGMKLKYRLAIAGVIFLSIPVIIATIPQQWLDKMDTIRTYEEDGSANARINAWIAAWNLALDKPLTGGGFQAIDYLEIVTRYNPEGSVSDLGVHSVYMEVLAENGFIAFVIYMLLMLSALGSNMKIRRWAIRVRNDTYHNYANLMIVSILALAISGIFLEMATFDLYLQVLALTVVLKLLAKDEIAAGRARGGTDERAAKIPDDTAPAHHTLPDGTRVPALQRRQPF